MGLTIGLRILKLSAELNGSRPGFTQQYGYAKLSASISFTMIELGFVFLACIAMVSR